MRALNAVMGFRARMATKMVAVWLAVARGAAIASPLKGVTCPLLSIASTNRSNSSSVAAATDVGLPQGLVSASSVSIYDDLGQR